MKKLLLGCAGLLLAAPAFTQPQQEPASADPRINQLIVYGDDPCPQSSDDEIVVCARLPDDDRFRIPDNLRANPNDPDNDSWVNRAIELSYVGRSGIGSCSTSGPGGMIGCHAELVRQARAERRGRDEVNWNRLIEVARQERLGRIDAESEAIEQELRPDE